MGFHSAIGRGANGFTGKVHHMGAKVGGTFKMSFTNFTTGTSIGFGGEYLELVPHERLRYTDIFDDPNLPGVISVRGRQGQPHPGFKKPGRCAASRPVAEDGDQADLPEPGSSACVCSQIGPL